MSSSPAIGFTGNVSVPQPLPGNPIAANAIIGNNGVAQVSVGPQRPREHWQLTSASVRVSSNTLEATCDIYVGNDVSTATFFAHSIQGSTGDICGFGGLDIQPGMQVFAIWNGGDIGSTATMVVNGTYSYGGQY